MRIAADQRGALLEAVGHAIQHPHAVGGLFLVVVGDPAQAEVFARLEQQLSARALALAADEGAVVVQVVDIAVVAGAVGRQPTGDGFRQRAGDGALALEVAALAAGNLHAAFGGEGRLAGADVDHPGGGVLAEQGALRAAQQFQLLDVQQVEHRHARAAEVDVVQVDPGAALQAVAGGVVADASHRDAGLPRVDVGDVDAGQHLLQVLHPVDLLLLQGGAAERGDRRRHFLYVFLTAPRGDGDLAQAGVFRSAVFRGLRGPGGGRRQAAAEGEQQGECIFRRGEAMQGQRPGDGSGEAGT
ncbi:hypothetical protein D3C81_1184310 [compost metagenome]